ncbi:MAG: hypothetical protein CSA52_01660 [Gammaproteobacteria bacterium]|nr:MAG: hypothetical protein CSB48_02965 [Pseudomonadota bacterium]PIE38618.1 MAG: hypothetical protein CSA52_01660 [Gammaproteobacteria bacterium]
MSRVRLTVERKYTHKLAVPVLFLLSLTGCGGGGTGIADGGDNGKPAGQVSACSDTASAAWVPEPDFYPAAVRYLQPGTAQSAAQIHKTRQADFSPDSVSFVAGSIQVPSGVMVDSDTADSAASTVHVSNNSIEQAQSLLNPVSVAGFVSRFAGFHYDPVGGSSPYPADTDDFYKITLNKGQLISLYSVDSVDGGAQAVCLLDSRGNETFTKTTGNRVKTMTVPESGHYYIQVHALSRAGLYQLVVGQGGVTRGAVRQSILSVDREFVPGQAIVKYSNQSVASAIAEAARGANVALTGPDGESVLTPLQPQNGTGALLDISSMVNRQLVNSGQVTATGVQAASDSQLKQATLDAIALLRRQEGVEYAEPNYIRRAFFEPSDPLYDAQWHYPLIHLPQAWSIAAVSDLAETRVAVIDTGIRSHVDMNGQIVEGFDFVDDDRDASDPGGSLHGGSDNFHGTHVAGTVAAVSNNGEGVAGVANLPDKNGRLPVRVIPVRVLDEFGSGADADIIEAIKYASGVANRSGITLTEEQRARVINLSLGGPGNSASLQDAIDLARANDVVVVAAAGNDGVSVKSFPAANDGVIAVGAVGPEQQRAPYSNFGQAGDLWLDVVAPGGDFSKDINGDGQPDGVLSTWDEDSYILLQGTSMASPHVAGVIALMRALSPDLSGLNIETLLENGDLTTELGARGKDPIFGFGLIDAALAAMAVSSKSVPAVLVASPARLNFGGSTDRLSLRLRNGGSQPLEVLTTDTDQPWLAISPKNIQADGTGEYLVSVNRNDLDIGVYSGKVSVVTTDGKTEELPVIMQVVDPAVASVDAGTQYVLLIRASTKDDVLPDTAQQITQVADGQYSYRFLNIDDDAYYLIAGTDMDNDGFICDEGEFCAEYPVLNEPELVNVAKDMDNLRMSTTYLLGFGQTGLNSGANSTVAGRRGYPRLLNSQ